MNEEASNEVDERYGAFRIADGRFVIYDTNTPTAWSWPTPERRSRYECAYR